uniref:Uncharacterized protein n=1 Tax=Mola mola TaxID=94237 RepID=A0A3Q3VT29_MOLML
MNSINIMDFHLQSNYRDYHDFPNYMLTVGAPHNIFSLHFPLWFHLSHNVGTKMIWVVVIGDCLNLILKQILFWQRPYLWVQETHLEQFRPLRSCLWMAFWLIQISVCISRVIPGLLAAFDNIPSVFSLAVCFYLLVRSHVDPMWSVTKAKIRCTNPDWIHLDTTPFAGVVRNLSALFGLGLTVNSQLFFQSCKGKNGYKTRFKLMCVTAAFISLQLYDFIKMPNHTEALFYILSLCRIASVPLCVVVVIPYCVHLQI